MTRQHTIAAGIAVLALIAMLLWTQPEQAPENQAAAESAAGAAPPADAPARASSQDRQTCAAAAQAYAARPELQPLNFTSRHTSHFHPELGKCFVKIDRTYTAGANDGKPAPEMTSVIEVDGDRVLGTVAIERDAGGKAVRITGITYDGPPGEMQMGVRPCCASEAEWNAFVDKYMN